jgi:hypothetical protein
MRKRRFCSQACSGAFFSGDGHPAWRGGITPIRQRLFNSPAYRAWRGDVLARDRGRCRWCEADGRRTYRPLEIHHIVPVSIAPTEIFNAANGITLCKPHHDQTRGKEDVFALFLASILGEALVASPQANRPDRVRRSA